MLSADEFAVGFLAEVTGLSLVLPRTQYELPFLVVPCAPEAVAICLEGQQAFYSFPSKGNRSWKGVIIPNVQIELDETSLFDADNRFAPSGTMVRRSTDLVLMTKEPGGFHAPIAAAVLTNLPACADDMTVGFSGWQVVLRKGDETRILKRIEIKQSS